MERIKVDSSYCKQKQVPDKLNKVLNVKSKTLQLNRKKYETIRHLGSEEFLKEDTKSIVYKKIQTYMTSCHIRKDPVKLKVQVTSWEKIFTMHKTDKTLVST